MSCKRVVLDTNVLISALLFSGVTSRIHVLWKRKSFAILVSREIVEEYIRVLAYPKFGLTEKEIKGIIHEELLPYIEPVSATYIEPVSATENINGVCVDPDDDKFLACAEAGKADFIVSGDAHLLNIKKYKGCPIVTPESFLKKLK